LVFCCFDSLFVQESVHSLCFQGEDKEKSWWTRIEQHRSDPVRVSHGSRQCSLRFQVLPTLFYLQGWIPRGLDQMVDLVPWDWEANSLEGAYWQDRDFWNLLKVQAISYFWHHLKKRLELEDTELPKNDLMKLVVRDIC
jgi:hypothetical protein